MRYLIVLSAVAMLVLLVASAPSVAQPSVAGPAVSAPETGTCSQAADSEYVRLRGCPDIHVRSCPKVMKADPEGIVPAKKDDGPPCYVCRRAECK
jgi:hypothetical protein